MRKKNLKFLGFPYHEIHEDGTVKSINRTINTKTGKRKLKGVKHSTKPSNNGYPHVTLNYNGVYKGFDIHRLLAICFIKNPNNYPCVNHIDGNKLNNSLNNLEWCSYVKNIRHAYKNGLTKIRKGEKSKSSKLTKKKVNKILKIVETTELSYKTIGEKFNISSSTVGDVVKGKVWNDSKFSIQDLEDYILSNKIKSAKTLIKKLKESYE